MSDISWIFDGIGTAIVTGLVGLLLGGTVGYKIGVKKTKIRQSQRASNPICGRYIQGTSRFLCVDVNCKNRINSSVINLALFQFNLYICENFTNKVV